MWRRSIAAAGDIASFAAPWRDGRTPIYDLIADARAAGRPVDAAVREARPPEDPDAIRFAPGALDSLLGGPESSPRQTGARTLTAAIGKVLRAPAAENAAHLFALLRDGETIAVVDEVIPRILREVRGREDALAALARRLLRESPEVEPVKAAIALLGVSGEAADAPLIATVGAYDEFTLYAAVAFANLLADPEEAIWNLAKSVRGWGRIEAVERLADTQNPAIKAWLLRDGFRNAIMNEYSAYLCATTGDLKTAIAAPEIDDDLLAGAGEIVEALIEGTPGTPIEDYEDGAAVCLAYMRHLSSRPRPGLDAIRCAVRIGKLTDGERREDLKAKPGWSAETLLEIKTLVGAVLRSPEARAAVDAALAGADGVAFNVAADLAASFGVDAWPHRLDRQKAGAEDGWNGQWWWLMQTADRARIDQVLDLARAQLDLARVGSGPSVRHGFGAEFKDDTALDFIVQELRHFPGQGWDLVKAALAGRTIRLRNMAINALRDWGEDIWPPDARAAIEAARRREPDDKVRARLRGLLDGALKDAEAKE